MLGLMITILVLYCFWLEKLVFEVALRLNPEYARGSNYLEIKTRLHAQLS